MKRWLVAAIAVFLILIAGVVSGLQWHSAKSSPVERLRGVIERANYCATDSDCSPLGPVCPFGCGLVVNRNERQRILDEILSFGGIKNDESKPKFRSDLSVIFP